MTWTLTVELDETTGEQYLQFPPDALEGLGWQPGDTIIWTDNNNGSWTLTKQQHDKTTSI
jgi:hypothetical protein